MAAREGSQRRVAAYAVAVALHLALLLFLPGADAITSPRPIEIAIRQPPSPVMTPPPKPIRSKVRAMAREDAKPVVAPPPVLTAPVVVDAPDAPALAQGETHVAAAVVPAPAAPGPVVPTAAAGEARFSLDGYRGDLFSHIADQRRYPLPARRMRLEGVTTVIFRVRTNGELASRPEVVSSSHPLLDAEALRMVEAAAPFPPMPRGAGEVVEFRIPIRFSLSG